MNIHEDLINLGFEVTEINNFNKKLGFLVYEKKIESDTVNLVFYNNGEITFNKISLNEPRELIFKILYTSDEFLIIEYLKHYVKIK